MGKERDATVSIDGISAPCRLLLEPGLLICRGGHKHSFKIPLLAQLSSAGGVLSFRNGSSRVELHLAADADKWLDAIQNPRSRLQKLGILPGMKVAILAAPADEPLGDIIDALDTPPVRRLASGLDLLFFFASEPGKLDRLSTIEPKLAPAGAVWTLWPKGRNDFTHDHVVAAANLAGLVQTKSLGFSPTFTALRLARPATKKKSRSAP